MTDSNTPEKNSTLKKALLIALISMLVLLVAWHLFLPMLAITVAVTAAVWAVMVISVVLVASVVLLFYVFSGVGILILCALSVAWIIFAIAFFPIVFPLLIPLLILLLFVAFVRRNKME